MLSLPQGAKTFTNDLVYLDCKTTDVWIPDVEVVFSLQGSY